MLYGRDAELAGIRQLVERARDGQSGALLVCGDAGTGKTALLEQAAQAAHGMQVMRGTCIESEAELPFAGLHLLLRSAMDQIAGLPRPQAAALQAAFGLADAAGADRYLTGLATLTLLAEVADAQPLLCLCDDAHWLDQASATALLFAARRLDAEGVAFVFGYRGGGGSFREDPGLPVMRLGPLDDHAAAQLLAEYAADLAPHVRDRILAQSEGNPLALIELSAALTPAQRAGQLDPRAFHVGTLPVPSRVQDAFGDQIAGLPERSRLLLVTAAADDTEDLGIVLQAAEALGASPEDLVPAEQARLIQFGGGILRFRHPLIRSAAYKSASWGVLTAVHRALAQAMSAAGQPDRQAWHLAAGVAGPDETTAAGLERAAEYARERGGYAAEAAAYERAAELSTSREAQGHRLGRAAAAMAAAGEYRRAGVMADRAARMMRDPVAIAGLAGVRASVEFDKGSPERAGLILLEGAAATAADTPGPAGRLLIEGVHCAVYGNDQGTADAAARMLAGLDLPPEFACFVPGAAGLAHLLRGELAEGVSAIRQTLRALPGSGAGLPPTLRHVAGTLALAAGDDHLAHDLMTAMTAECRAEGMISQLPFAMQVLAIAEQYLGLHADARASATEALRIASDTGQSHRVVHLSAVLARIAAIEGDEDGCRRLSAPGEAQAIVPVAATAGTSLALLDIGLGRYDAALTRFTALSGGPARDAFITTFSLPDFVEAAVGARREDLAAAALGRFEAFASSAGQPWASAVALRCRAQLGADPGANFPAAVELHAGASRPFERARTELAYGRWLRRGRRRADARVRLESAHATFARLGAAPWAAQARRELRASGATPAPDATGTDLATRLTPQELQVVRRAAGGLSNREIAAELFLSPRTVGYHLYKAYPKLGVTTRAQLAALKLSGQ
jgi:DNA-binding CsgD family transcriptional regulator